VNTKGLFHIYTGDGKGKTTCALGLAIRAAGAGKKVAIVQLMKGRDCGELSSLGLIPGIEVLRLSRDMGFTKNADCSTIGEMRKENDENMKKAIERAERGDCDMLIIDEAFGAYSTDTVDRGLIDGIAEKKPAELELVMTGRNAPGHLVELADYVTEMKLIKHPFNEGVPARKGIEF